MDAYSEREWARFAMEQGGIGTCMVKFDCPGGTGQMLALQTGERVTALFRVPEELAPEEERSILVYNGQLGFVRASVIEPAQPFTVPGIMPEDDALGDGSIAPLSSLSIPEGYKLVNYPMIRESRLLEGSQAREAREMKTPVIRNERDDGRFETPRAPSSSQMATFVAEPSPVLGQNEIASLADWEGAPAVALTDDAPAPTQRTANKVRSLYQPGSVRTSVVRTSVDWENKDVWDDSEKQYDPTESIYDEYFAPSFQAHDADLAPPPVLGRDDSVDSSVDSLGSFRRETHGVDAIMPPVHDTAHNRLLHGFPHQSFESSSTASSHPISDSFTHQRSDSGVPIATLEELNLDVPPQTEASWMQGISNARNTKPPAFAHPQQSAAPPRASQDSSAGGRSLAPSDTSLFGSSRKSMENGQYTEAQLFQHWTRLLTDRKSSSRATKKARELAEIGVPSALRGRIWLLLAGDRMHVVPGVFEERCNDARESVEHPDRFPFSQLIENDLQLCFPANKPFMGLEGATRDDIKWILHAYAYHNPDVGYTEGMCLVVGLLLTHLQVADAFWMLDAIVTGYGMDKCYTGSMEQLHVDNMVIDEVLRLVDTQVHEKLQAMQIEPIMFLPGWTLPLFVRTLPWPTLLRVWDMYLAHGHLFLVRTAVSVICLARNAVLSPTLSAGRAETLKQLVFVESPPLRPDAVLEGARRLPVTDKELMNMQKNGVKLLDDHGAVHGATQQLRPSAFQGKLVSRSTLRLLLGRKKKERTR